jgi:hypothetical protein
MKISKYKMYSWYVPQSFSTTYRCYAAAVWRSDRKPADVSPRSESLQPARLSFTKYIQSPLHPRVGGGIKVLLRYSPFSNHGEISDRTGGKPIAVVTSSTFKGSVSFTWSLYIKINVTLYPRTCSRGTLETLHETPTFYRNDLAMRNIADRWQIHHSLNAVCLTLYKPQI